MDVTAWITGLLVAGVVLSLAMILWFLWKIYDRGGPTHLESGAKALREVYDPEWSSKLMKYLRSDRKGGDTEDEELDEEVVWQQGS